MTWNYRVILHPSLPALKCISGYYGLHEVHYNSKNEIIGYTEEPLIAANLEEGRLGIIKSLELMLKDANNAPILIEEEIKFADEGGDEDNYLGTIIK